MRQRAFDKTRPESKNKTGEKILVQPKREYKNRLQKDKIVVSVVSATVDKTARIIDTRDATAAMALCLSLNLGNL